MWVYEAGFPEQIQPRQSPAAVDRRRWTQFRLRTDIATCRQNAVPTAQLCGGKGLHFTYISSLVTPKLVLLFILTLARIIEVKLIIAKKQQRTKKSKLKM